MVDPAGINDGRAASRVYRSSFPQIAEKVDLAYHGGGGEASLIRDGGVAFGRPLGDCDPLGADLNEMLEIEEARRC